MHYVRTECRSKVLSGSKIQAAVDIGLEALSQILYEINEPEDIITYCYSDFFLQKGLENVSLQCYYYLTTT